MTIAIIPARGGSKRIPRKNLVDFGGKPMIVHSIIVAQRSELFDRIIVSTDDEEIADTAIRFGAEVPFRRSAALSDDYAPTIPVIADAIEQTTNPGLELVCCIYATAPLLEADDIRQGYAVISEGEWDYVLSATSFDFPIFRGFRDNGSQGLEMVFPQHQTTRSQDLPEILHDAGQFYWGRTDAWLNQRPIFGPKTTAVRLPRWRVQDIDTPEDLERARRIVTAFQG